MTKEEVDADFKAFLDILAIAQARFTSCHHQLL